MPARLTEDAITEQLSAFLPRRTSETRVGMMGAGSDDLGAGRAYLAASVDGGWQVPEWPAEHGGRGADADETASIRRVARQFVVPDLYAFGIGLGMVGPTLLVHGTDAQRARWMRPIASGAEIWCQMFSEPDAGSDLANVALRADRDGDEWHLTGQKVWTSRAAYSDWGLCLARTDPEVPKHRGLTMFAVAMHQPGVEVRPLEQMNGDQHFSEVFLDGAIVPDTDRIGDVDAGWTVAMTVLAHERAGSDRGGGDSSGRAERLPDWVADLAAAGALSDPVRRDVVTSIYGLEQTGRWTRQRAAASPGPAGSGNKLRTVRWYQERAYAVNRAQGAAGMLTGAEGHIETLTAPSMSIRGGTDEIQRNILGERVLGLPGEPRLGRDVPWSRSRHGVL
jgi:alkylation response protein AidB-like acyl-CoA dehydrogenase